jgi:hypothetical protein
LKTASSPSIALRPRKAARCPYFSEQGGNGGGIKRCHASEIERMP